MTIIWERNEPLAINKLIRVWKITISTSTFIFNLHFIKKNQPSVVLIPKSAYLATDLHQLSYDQCVRKFHL